MVLTESWMVRVRHGLGLWCVVLEVWQVTISINMVSDDKNGSKTGTGRDTVLGGVGIFFILLCEWFYLPWLS